VVLYDQYGKELLEALAAEERLRGQIVAWLEVAREHRGVVRASQELTRTGSLHLEAAEQLRSAAAVLIAKRLGRPAKAKGASLMIVDILSQYAFMEAAGWTPHREPDAVAVQLEWLVQKGLYG